MVQVTSGIRNPFATVAIAKRGPIKLIIVKYCLIGSIVMVQSGSKIHYFKGVSQVATSLFSEIWLYNSFRGKSTARLIVATQIQERATAELLIAVLSIKEYCEPENCDHSGTESASR